MPADQKEQNHNLQTTDLLGPAIPLKRVDFADKGIMFQDHLTLSVYSGRPNDFPDTQASFHPQTGVVRVLNKKMGKECLVPTVRVQFMEVR